MYKLLFEINAWYDRLPNSYRFSVFIMSLLGALVPMNLGISFHYPSLVLLGATWFEVLLLVGSVRAYGMGGFHKYLGVFLFLYAAVHLAAIAFMFYWWVQ